MSEVPQPVTPSPAPAPVVVNTGAMAQFAAGFSSIASKSPHWAALLAVVGGFLFYMDRGSAQADIVAKQRIESCHAIQVESTEMLEVLNKTLIDMQVSNALLIAEWGEMRHDIEQHEDRADDLRVRQ